MADIVYLIDIVEDDSVITMAARSLASAKRIAAEFIKERAGEGHFALAFVEAITQAHVTESRVLISVDDESAVSIALTDLLWYDDEGDGTDA